jgi:hypothetical protein
LEADIQAVIAENSGAENATPPARDTAVILEEVVETVRDLKRANDAQPNSSMIRSLANLSAEFQDLRSQVQMDYTRAVRARALDEDLIINEIRGFAEQAGVTASVIRVGEAMPNGSIHLYLNLDDADPNEPPFNEFMRLVRAVPRYAGMNINGKLTY